MTMIGSHKNSDASKHLNRRMMWRIYLKGQL
jgi:hypothetical protein